MAREGGREGRRRRRLELGVTARGGTNPPSNKRTAPVKQKRISQALPFPQGWWSLLSTARYLLPLSPFPWHHKAHVLSLLAGTMMQSHPYPLRLGKGWRGKETLPGWKSCPRAVPHSLVQPQRSLLPRSGDRNRYSVGLLGLDGRSCALLSYYKAQFYIKWFVSIFLLAFGFSLGFAPHCC